MKARHTSLDKHLKHNILWIESLPEVQKVVIGRSEACRHKYAPGHVRFKSEVEAGIRVNAYSGKGVTDIFIRISPITACEGIRAKIEERFKSE